MRRALDIARGVLHRPPILFLDEPTIGLDVINRGQIWRFLHRLRTEEGSTLMLSTHYMDEVEGCGRGCIHERRQNDRAGSSRRSGQRRRVFNPGG